MSVVERDEVVGREGVLDRGGGGGGEPVPVPDGWYPAPVLDYGGRAFRVRLDTRLRPHVVDPSGAPAGDLPEAGPGDDPVLVAAARDRYAALRLELRLRGADEIRRLQRAMVVGRRWSGAVFRRGIVGHPLLGPAVPGLVWAVFDDAGAVAGSFRVVGGEPVDVHGDAFPVGDAALVGVAHPVSLGAAVPAWAAVFGAAGIAQPFPQLAREVGRLAGDERARTVLTRYAGRAVPASRLSGLRWHGWRPGEPDETGRRRWIGRDLPGGLAVVATVDPPLRVGHPDGRDRVVTGVRVVGRDVPPDGLRWGEIDPVLVSEVLRDLDRAMS